MGPRTRPELPARSARTPALIPRRHLGSTCRGLPALLLSLNASGTVRSPIPIAVWCTPPRAEESTTVHVGVERRRRYTTDGLGRDVAHDRTLRSTFFLLWVRCGARRRPTGPVAIVSSATNCSSHCMLPKLHGSMPSVVLAAEVAVCSRLCSLARRLVARATQRSALIARVECRAECAPLSRAHTCKKKKKELACSKTLGRKTCELVGGVLRRAHPAVTPPTRRG